MQFKDIIGQGHLKQQLISSVREGHVPHAQMFLGPLGFGGLPIAMAYAQYLNCVNPQPADSCGECPSCLKMQKLAHPDLHFSFPFPNIENRKISTEFITEWREVLNQSPYLSLHRWMVKFNAENKQPNIPIKECQDVMRRLSFKAYEQGYKIMLIWLPEYLGKEGNTLLKIFEEPPAQTVFLLVAENLETVLSTIVSRMQIIKVPPIVQQQLADALVNLQQLQPDEAYRIAGLANGDYIEALDLINHSAGEHAELFEQWIEIILSRNVDPMAHVRWADTFGALGREAQKSFMVYALHILREVLHLQVYGKPSDVLIGSEKNVVGDMAGKFNQEKMARLADWLNDAYYHIERNASGKILMLDLSIRLTKLVKPQNAAV
jgi:DNA polymerase-3 subunit delta'